MNASPSPSPLPQPLVVISGSLLFVLGFAADFAGAFQFLGWIGLVGLGIFLVGIIFAAQVPRGPGLSILWRFPAANREKAVLIDTALVAGLVLLIVAKLGPPPPPPPTPSEATPTSTASPTTGSTPVPLVPPDPGRTGGGPIWPIQADETTGSVTAFCNAGTQGVGVIHNHDNDYSLENYDTVLESDSCTDRQPIGWSYVQGFYVGPNHCVDVRIDGSPAGPRIIESGQWFYEDMIAGTYNLNVSNC